MKAFNVVMDGSDSNFLVLAESLSEVESKLESNGYTNEYMDICEIKQLDYDTSHIVA